MDLQRTVLRAPFNAVIRSESVDLGQYVRSGTAVATLAGTDHAEIVVPLPLEELAWLQIPRAGQGGNTTALQLYNLMPVEKTFDWAGKVVRQLGDVDPQGRMARLVVTVNDPYQLRQGAGERPVLSMGIFVQVLLHGKELKDVAVIPANALRDGATVWLMDDGYLKVRSVKVVRRTRDEVVIGQGLASGDRVVLTNLAGATEGMKLRPVGTDPASDGDGRVEEGS